MKKYSRFRRVRQYIVPILLTAAILAVAWHAFADAGESASRQQYDNMMRRINQAVTACYALEGRYPPSFDYLTQHYGVRVDPNQYVVSYSIIVSNIRPAIVVRPADRAGVLDD